MMRLTYVEDCFDPSGWEGHDNFFGPLQTGGCARRINFVRIFEQLPLPGVFVGHGAEVTEKRFSFAVLLAEVRHGHLGGTSPDGRRLH